MKQDYFFLILFFVCVEMKKVIVYLIQKQGAYIFSLRMMSLHNNLTKLHCI